MLRANNRATLATNRAKIAVEIAKAFTFTCIGILALVAALNWSNP